MRPSDITDGIIAGALQTAVVPKASSAVDARGARFNEAVGYYRRNRGAELTLFMRPEVALQ